MDSNVFAIRLRTLACAAFVACASTLQAQNVAADSAAGVDSAKATVIRRLLEVTHVADQMILTMESTLPAQRAAMPNVPGVFWDRFLARARDRRGEFSESLIPIYDRQFSLADLQEVLRFYETPVGKRLLEAQPRVTQEAIVHGQQWGARLAQEVAVELVKDGVTLP